MTEEKLLKLYESFEASVRRLTYNSRELQEMQIDGDYKNYTLNLAEKNEIAGIFNVMSSVTVSDFNSMIKPDDISKNIHDLMIKVRQNPSLLDSVRQLLNSKPSQIFNELLNECALNYDRGNQGNKYSEKLKNFATLLYSKAGKKAYKFLEMNATLPSVSLCLQNIHENYGEMVVGKIYGESLKNFLERNNLPKIVSISEDATRVKAYLRYDPRLKELIGVVIPHDENGLPNHKTLRIKTPADAVNLVKKYQRAKFVEVIMAKALCEGLFKRFFDFL
jgi:hypothetical protein